MRPFKEFSRAEDLIGVTQDKGSQESHDSNSSAQSNIARMRSPSKDHGDERVDPLNGNNRSSKMEFKKARDAIQTLRDCYATSEKRIRVQLLANDGTEELAAKAQVHGSCVHDFDNILARWQEIENIGDDLVHEFLVFLLGKAP